MKNKSFKNLLTLLLTIGMVLLSFSSAHSPLPKEQQFLQHQQALSRLLEIHK